MTPDYFNKTQVGTEAGSAISAQFNALEQPARRLELSEHLGHRVVSLFKFREVNAGDLIVAAGPVSAARLDTQE